ncbi:MAG: PKD domain-containing protein [Deltaproteobacteria bacterium]|nr:PKD domain-containing protein [Deltaproteobacteria bacterium]
MKKRLRIVRWVTLIIMVWIAGAASASAVVDFNGCTAVPGPIPVYVKFTDMSSGEVEKWSWDFGDGGTSYDQSPLHTYYEEGCYDVGLVAHYEDGSKDTTLRENCVCIGVPVLEVAPEELDVGYARGVIPLALSQKGNGDMRWTASVVKGNDWLTIAAEASGTGSGNIMLSYDTWLGDVPRVGTLNVVSAEAVNRAVDVVITQEPLPKDATKTTCMLSSEAVAAGEPVTISGSVMTIKGREPVGDAMVEVVLSGPGGEHVLEAFTDETGAYAMNDFDAFNRVGAWSVMTHFYGHAGFKASVSRSCSLEVVSKSATGYAVLVQGRFEGNEGIEAHGKSIETIYSVLRARNIAANNIRTFGYNLTEVADVEQPSRTVLEEALTCWARDNMSLEPAPLYVVFLGHGAAETFYLYPETVTAGDVSGWLQDLENGLGSYDFSENPVHVYIGACQSGSFIPKLSQKGRVIITSAAANESSARGPLDADSVREGCYFLSEFFKQAGRGRDLKQCFDGAVGLVKKWTHGSREQGRAAGKVQQHPCIDDNGDATASIFSSPVPGEDGATLVQAYLGASSIFDRLEIIDVAPAVTLEATDPLPRLWIELNDRALVASLRLEIRPPGFGAASTDVTQQIIHDDFASVQASVTSGNDSRFEIDSYDGYMFSEEGAHEVFYFVKDASRDVVLPPVTTVVYRNADQNSAPDPFNLSAPADRAKLYDAPVLFDWEPAEDPDGDVLTYSLVICSNSPCAEEIIRIDDIATSSHPLDISDDLRDVETYYWMVEAVDTGGARTVSRQTWSFYKDFSNIVQGFLEGYVTSVDTGMPLTGVKITSNCGAESRSDQGVFYLPGPEGSFQATASLSGYRNQPFDFTLMSGQTTYLSVSLHEFSPPDPCGTSTDDNCTVSCALESVADGQKTVTLYRRLRDDVLKDSAAGRRYVKAYYRYGAVIKAVFADNVELKEQFAALLLKNIDWVQALIAGNAESLTLEQKQEISFFVERLRRKVSPGMQHILRQVKKDVRKDLLPVSCKNRYRER